MNFTARHFVLVLAISAMALFLAACPGSGSTVNLTLTPSSVELAPGETLEFVASVSGVSNPNVSWEMTGGTVAGNGPVVTYTAPTLIGTYTLTAISQADPTRSTSATIEVVGEVGITISPSTVRLAPGDTFPFTATIAGLEDQSVRWEASGGNIAGTGTTMTYTAPDAVGTYTVTAISQVDETLRAVATVEVAEGASSASITLEPSTVRLAPGDTQEFTATVEGLEDSAVTWEASSGSVAGTDTTISYTAPSEVGTYTLTAISQADATLRADATITVPADDSAPTLPPDPGDPGDDTVGGIDSDRDGVRDDVQRYIQVTYPGDKPTLDILTDYAKALQEAVLKPHNNADLIKLEQKALELTFCLAQWRPESFSEDQQRFLSAFFNTPERFKAEMNYRKSVPTSIYEVGNDLLQSCSQEVRAKRLGSSQAAGEREIIFYLNGVRTSLASGQNSQIALHYFMSRRVALLYNQTRGILGFLDLVEVTAQKYNEPVEKFRDWIYGLHPNISARAHFVGLLSTAVTAKAQAEDLATFRAKYEQYKNANFKVVIVAHSQGNLFANQLYDMILNDPKTPKKEGKICGLDVVAVGTPANRTVGSGAYVTNTSDFVIKPIPSSLKGNATNSPNINPIDYTGHGFAETYINDWGNDTRSKIKKAIEGAFSSSLYPDDCGSPPEVDLTVTPMSGVAPLTVTATASATDDGEIVDYTFNFSDGQTKSGKQSTAQHVYKVPGSYGITVTVTDDTSKTAYDSATIDVLPDKQEYIGYFERYETVTSTSETAYTYYNCKNEWVDVTYTDNFEAVLLASATLNMVTSADGFLEIVSVQNGTYTRTEKRQGFDSESGPSERNYSLNANFNGLRLDSDVNLKIGYTGFYTENSTYTLCGTTYSEDKSGEVTTSARFYWDGSMSGEEPVENDTQDYCDERGCYSSSTKSGWRWKVTPK